MGDEKIILYGTSWCGASRVARRLLDENHIEYQWVDIDLDMDGRKYVEQVNRGYRSVPTIVFPDGSMLVEPTSTVLKQKLGVV
ncbi:MAG TPA: glutaredoxin domain-containing protein [Anaerolinea sp.]|nr:glutaredoxin domain-containing protein [Anaerolinea sp.]